MAECTLVVTTEIDGTKNEITRVGDISRREGNILLAYKEADAVVDMRFEGRGVRIFRRGDYALSLSLDEAKPSVGTLTLGGNAGKLDVLTKKIRYDLLEDSFEAELHYLLRFGGDGQDTRVSIRATF